MNNTDDVLFATFWYGFFWGVISVVTAIVVARWVGDYLAIRAANERGKR